MSKHYLDPGDPGSFLDYPKKPRPNVFGADQYEECPTCQGHGGWNLQVDAYRWRFERDGLEDTPENRHKFGHFKTYCTSCWGWGWIRKGSCAHEWKQGDKVGHCLTEWTCTKCGAVTEIDSSD